jgi:hypothetical protein
MELFSVFFVKKMAVKKMENINKTLENRNWKIENVNQPLGKVARGRDAMLCVFTSPAIIYWLKAKSQRLIDRINQSPINQLTKSRR